MLECVVLIWWLTETMSACSVTAHGDLTVWPISAQSLQDPDNTVSGPPVHDRTKGGLFWEGLCDTHTHTTIRCLPLWKRLLLSGEDIWSIYTNPGGRWYRCSEVSLRKMQGPASVIHQVGYFPHRQLLVRVPVQESTCGESEPVWFLLTELHPLGAFKDTVTNRLAVEKVIHSWDVLTGNQILVMFSDHIVLWYTSIDIFLCYIDIVLNINIQTYQHKMIYSRGQWLFFALVATFNQSEGRQRRGSSCSACTHRQFPHHF